MAKNPLGRIEIDFFQMDDDLVEFTIQTRFARKQDADIEKVRSILRGALELYGDIDPLEHFVDQPTH